MERTRDKIKEYIKDNFLFGYSDDEIKNDTSFFELGVLDSTGIMELVTYIEREFGIAVKDEEIVQENLDSINRITDFVLKKMDSKN